MDPTTLARVQFAMTVMFHFLFPAITVGLGLVVAILETLRWRTRDPLWDRTALFWTRIFGLTFLMGVATGIVMEFQFGTNWARYSAFVGDVFGAPLAAEGVFAFFLESTFLGVLLFGRSIVSSTVRWLAAVLVALGSTLSAFWIIVADSWMQTPAGYVVEGGHARLTDFWTAVLNLSTLTRFSHTVVSTWVMGAFLVLGVSSFYLLSRRHRDVALASIRVALVVAFVGTLLIFVTGDRGARQVAVTQEAKFAAMQGVYTTTVGAPLVIWSLPPTQDPADAVQAPEIVVTRLLSFLAFGNVTAAVRGLSEFPLADWPPVALTFLAYHNMVAIGTLLLVEMLAAALLVWRGTLESHRTWLRILMWSTPLPMIAIQLGWMTAEVGRQPWLVYGVFRTQDGVSDNVATFDLALSLALFAAAYLVIAWLWIRLFVGEVRRGPAVAA
ncbi:MAG: cytochrome ubiquinol oxidase subunit I [Chloroflexota bacterium]|nr:cytochrome ubiquinol oxidase subunit I [Chloroflexota bacterium]